MKTTENYLAEIKEIRKMMEESSRFLSLSGLSGILIGIYALAGAFFAYQIIYHSSPEYLSGEHVAQPVTRLLIIAGMVLLLAFVTTIWLTFRRAKKMNKKIWNPGSRLMLLNLSIPLLSGGIFILVFIFREMYSIISPACLIFYGLALVNAAKFTRQEIFYMGILQITLGILAALFPAIGLLFWALGFGVIHIIYGALMYFRYEHRTKTDTL